MIFRLMVPSCLVSCLVSLNDKYIIPTDSILSSMPKTINTFIPTDTHSFILCLSSPYRLIRHFTLNQLNECSRITIPLYLSHCSYLWLRSNPSILRSTMYIPFYALFMYPVWSIYTCSGLFSRY